MDIELERTFLLKYKPENLEKSRSVDLLDIYFPKEEYHPVLRLRNRDNKKFELTKKFPINGDNSSEQEEHTIVLSKEEYDVFAKMDGKKVHKTRYYYEMPNGSDAEIDIFKDELEGLRLVDFEFKTKDDKEKFSPPDFCHNEVTYDKWMAGGILAGGKYSDFEEFLKKHNYEK
jgi:adenylate cyclase